MRGGEKLTQNTKHPSIGIQSPVDKPTISDPCHVMRPLNPSLDKKIPALTAAKYKALVTQNPPSIPNKNQMKLGL